MVVKHVLKHCSGKTMPGIRFSGRNSWANAQARCRKEKDCWGVYDSGCRKSSVYLCSKAKLRTASRLSRYALFVWFAWVWARVTCAMTELLWHAQEGNPSVTCLLFLLRAVDLLIRHFVRMQSCQVNPWCSVDDANFAATVSLFEHCVQYGLQLRFPKTTLLIAQQLKKTRQAATPRTSFLLAGG